MQIAFSGMTGTEIAALSMMSSRIPVFQSLCSTRRSYRREEDIGAAGQPLALVLYRLRQDPRLEAALEGNWLIVKYRYLRWLGAREWITPDLWKDLLEDDPLQWDASPQMQML
jgi:hypothetical protein